MRTVWKAKLEFAEKLTMKVPQGANVLCVQVHHGVPCMWLEVDDTLPKEKRTFLLVASGDKMPQGAILAYKGTFQKDEGNLVYHVFELIHSGRKSKTKQDGSDDSREEKTKS